MALEQRALELRLRCFEYGFLGRLPAGRHDADEALDREETLVGPEVLQGDRFLVNLEDVDRRGLDGQARLLRPRRHIWGRVRGRRRRRLLLQMLWLPRRQARQRRRRPLLHQRHRQRRHRLWLRRKAALRARLLRWLQRPRLEPRPRPRRRRRLLRRQCRRQRRLSPLLR
jgi:hypothetical protein